LHNDERGGPHPRRDDSPMGFESVCRLVSCAMIVARLDILDSDREGRACTARMMSSSAYSIASKRAVLSMPRVSSISQSGEPRKPTLIPLLERSRANAGFDIEDGGIVAEDEEIVAELSEGVSRMPRSARLALCMCREASMERLEWSDMLMSW
jgi:hypothetical protein